jgi:uncharacterized RDD family membrane protein YckC
MSDLVFDQEATRVSGRRFWAHFVDGVLLTIILVVLLIPATATGSNTLTALVLVAWFTVVQVAYYVLLARKDGRTPGKRLAGIRVVTADGKVPTQAALVKRTVPLLIEYFYVIAWIGMMASPYRQRFGDRWAKSYVVHDGAVPATAPAAAPAVGS